MNNNEHFGELLTYEIDNTWKYLFAIFNTNKVVLIDVVSGEFVRKIEVPGLTTNRLFIDENCCFMSCLEPILG